MITEEAVRALSDARFGPMLQLRSTRVGRPEPPWWVATTRMARTPAGNPFPDDSGSGAGTSLDESQAIARAVGEGLERYSAMAWSPDFVTETLSGGGFLDRWPRCAAEEAAPAAMTVLPPYEPLQSVVAQRLVDGAAVAVPAGQVILGYHAPAGEPVVTIPISTGLAFHPGPAGAIWNGLCEVIERDAVMSSWWLRHGGRRITTDGAPHEIIERTERMRRCGAAAELYDITTDAAIPTVFGVLRSVRYPHLVVAAATRASAAEACAKVLDELVSMRFAMRADDQARTAEPSPAPETLIAHAAYYARAMDHPAFGHLAAAPPVAYAEFAARSITTPRDMADLTAAAAALDRVGLTVLWVDVTTPEVRPFGTVARVVVPEAVPLSPTHRVRWLGMPRLRALASDTPGFSQYSADPHPFA